MTADRTLAVQRSVRISKMDKKPYELRILGSTGLTGPVSGSGDAIVRQPKRLALLAYLALRTAAGFRRRDEVIGLFWPELDQAQGRTYLRKALHALRADLGDNVILTRGDDEIRIDRSLFWCDAVALREDEQAGRHREALDLYKGELLAGLFPDGVAQDFEEWLRHERQTLRHAAARSAWECARAEEARGETGAAAALARRALEIEPDDEEGVRRLMVLLDKRGDRGGALRVYAEWQAHLNKEYGVEPAPETRKLARHVQAARKGESHETPPALAPIDRSPSVTTRIAPTANTEAQHEGASTRHRPAAVMLGFVIVAAAAVLAFRFVNDTQTEHAKSVAVLPFRTIGDSALHGAADAVEEEIITALAMDSTLVVKPVTQTEEPSARDAKLIGRHLGPAYAIHGAVQRSGNRLRVTLRLVRIADGTAVWAGRVDADDADRGDLARRLAADAAVAISRRIAEN